MKKLRAGIIGLGVGEKHIDGYQSHPDCEVVALCDFDENKLAAALKNYPHLRLTPNAGDILEDPEIDIVSIASFDNFHYEQVIRALKNNKHVFVEKPICVRQKELEHIRALLNEKLHLHLSSNLILRMSPRFRLLKEMIARGELGQPYYIEGDYNFGRLQKITEGWRGALDFYSVVYGGGIHLIDLMLWLTGDSIVEVSAYGNRLASTGTNFRFNDMVVSILKFQSGLIGKMAANFGCIFPHFHALEVYGTRASFINGLEHASLFKSRDSVEYEKITAAYPGVQKSDLLHSFINSILHDSPPEVSTEDVFRSMSVCFAIEEAASKSGPVTVKYI